MPETAVALVVRAGVFNIGFALFHAGFPLIFAWRTRLSKLDPINRAITQVLNIALIIVFALSGYWLIQSPNFFLGNFIAQDFLVGAATFWTIRAILQPIYFGLRHWASIALFVIFLGGAVLHAAPLVLLPQPDYGNACGNAELPPRAEN